MLARPRGLQEAWAAVLGGGLMLLLGLESWRQAWHTTVQGLDVLLFLLALMLFSSLLDRSGFFEWAAIQAARAAHGSGKALYRNVFLLGAVITAFLSLDTTAIILTPIVLAFVVRLKLQAKPFLLACVFVANTGSLLLPVSNLTNLLFQSAFHLSFGAFALRMALPQIAALAVNYFLFRWRFRGDLPSSFPLEDLPEPSSVIPDRPYFVGSLAILGCVLIGYFVGALNSIPPYIVALLGCFLLGAWGLVRRQIRWDIFREVSWTLFPFVIGLFVVIQGVENLGLAQAAAHTLATAGRNELVQMIALAFGAGIGSNIVNNIPMALLSIAVLQHSPASSAAPYAALLGCDLGPNLTIAGSLATMLVISSARRKGEEISAWQFLQAGLWTMPALLLAAIAGLWLSLKI